MDRSILIVEDQAPAAKLVLDFLSAQGYLATHCSDAESASQALRKGRFDLVLLDLGLPDRPGEELLEDILASRPWLPVIMTTGKLEVSTALDCLRKGARDYVTKPYKLALLGGAIQRELRRSSLSRRLRALRDRVETRGLDRLKGEGAGMRGVKGLLAKAAEVDIGVLVGGETGTGKDLAALALHEASARRQGPFIALDCGALPEKLLESELFGYERGAFTGADTAKKGRLEAANKGSIFLDEVGELSLESQAKLLRVLQERRLRRVGGKLEIPVDIRVIAATNVDLAEARRSGRFREDLYHRLAEFTVEMPPLRERREDIPVLAETLLSSAALAFEKPVAGIDDAAMKALVAYPWPGNVRELLHVLRQGLLRCGQSLGASDLPDRLTGRVTGGAESPVLPLAQRLQEAVDQAEKVMVGRALEACRWHRGEAAERLGIDAKTLQTRMKRHGYDEKD